jgi:hypothetical protein
MQYHIYQLLLHKKQYYYHIFVSLDSKQQNEGVIPDGGSNSIFISWRVALVQMASYTVNISDESYKKQISLAVTNF